MPSCVAPDCKNSSKKGFLMTRFPKNPKRRKEWAINIGRKNWSPTNISTLCELHFAPDMWQKTRKDGKRKLKLSAVPTLYTKPKIQSPTEEDTCPDLSACGPIIANERVEIIIIKTEPDSDDCNNINTNNSNNVLDINDPLNLNISPVRIASADQSLSASKDSFSSQSLEKMEKTIQSYEEAFRRDSRDLKNLKNELSSARHRIKVLEQKLKGREIESDFLKAVFNVDQILALKKRHELKSSQCIVWSKDTIIKALKLKHVCGIPGYKEILRQNLPYPSLRTLERAKYLKSDHLQIQNDTVGWESPEDSRYIEDYR